MFQFFKKSNEEKMVKDVELRAIAKGEMVNIEEVPDKMFANKLLGDGVAFIFETDTVFAPCDGKVLMIAETKHAIGIQTANNAEIMIHIGIDTVNFAGQGFEAFIESGQEIKCGQPMVKIDRAFFSKQGINLITPMIVTTPDYKLEIQEAQTVDLHSLVMKIL
jgi:PTS system, glucose subfamily, IIA component